MAALTDDGDQLSQGSPRPLDQERQEVADSVLEEVIRVSAIADDGEHEQAVNNFIAEHSVHFKRIASRLCKNNSVRHSQFSEDIEAIVLEEAWLLLDRCRRDPAFLASVRTFMGAVFTFARPKVRSFTDRATAPMSGMVGMQRRRRELARTRSEIAAQRGRMPSVAETVDETNRRLAATRKNAVRQGMVVSEADELAFRGALSFDESIDSDDYVDISTDCMLHPAEGPTLVRTVVQRAAEADDTCGQVARLWMTEAYTSGGPPPGSDTIIHIARTLGITKARTASYVEQIRSIAIDYLMEMGITGLDEPEAKSA